MYVSTSTVFCANSTTRCVSHPTGSDGYHDSHLNTTFPSDPAADKRRVPVTTRWHYMHLGGLTSTDGHRLLQDADVKLQGQLGGRAQEGLDDRGAGEGCSVCKQFPFRLPHLSLHLLRLTPPGHLLFPGDADIRLLYLAHTAIDAECLQTPAGPENRRTHTVKYSIVHYQHIC